MQDDREKIEMFISCRSLKNMDHFSKSDPQVILYVQGTNGQYSEYGRTEVIQNNLNPNFMKTFTIDYIFEIQQCIRFDVIDYDGPNSFDFIGSCNTSISKLMGTKNQTSILDLLGKTKNKNGKLIARCEKIGSCREILQAKIVGEKIADIHTFSKTSPFLKLFRTREDGQLLLIHQTEHVHSNLNPNYKQIQIKLSKLCNGDHLLPIRVECWDYQSNGSHNYVGETTFTISELEQNQKRFELKNLKKKKSAGFINFESFTLIDRPEFIDFIRGGTQLSLVCAIDFTGSNGVPSDPYSLHTLRSKQLNQYQSAIVSVGEILINYDYNKLVPTFGFGGKPKLPNFSTNTVLHCFPVNGQPQNAQCAGIQGVLDAYTNLLAHIELSGPTLFDPIITETMKIAKMHKDQNSPVYTILLILTDGVIHDMDKTIVSIVDSAHLPLSIIIIGVGNEDFSNMEILDGDQGLYDSQGRKAQRDLVQFVPYNKYKGNPTELARNVLYELPDQVIQYYQMIGVKPMQAQVIDITAMTGLNEPTEQLGKGLAQGGFMQNLLAQGGEPQLQQQQQNFPVQNQPPQQGGYYNQQQQIGGSAYQPYPSLSGYIPPQQQQGPYQPTQAQSDGTYLQNPLMMQFGQNLVQQQAQPQQGYGMNQQGLGLGMSMNPQQQPSPRGLLPQQPYGQQPQQGVFNQYEQPQPQQYYQQQK